MTHKSPDEERTAVYAGSFNPFTRGHLSIASRAAEIFDRLIIAIGANADKRGADEDLRARRDAIDAAIASLPGHLRERIATDIYVGQLTADFAASRGARWLVRGARSGSEYDSEMALADINRRISGIETIIIPSLAELASCSSSVVRELQSYGHDTSFLLPES